MTQQHPWRRYESCESSKSAYWGLGVVGDRKFKGWKTMSWAVFKIIFVKYIIPLFTEFWRLHPPVRSPVLSLSPFSAHLAPPACFSVSFSTREDNLHSVADRIHNHQLPLTSILFLSERSTVIRIPAVHHSHQHASQYSSCILSLWVLPVFLES